MAMLTPRQREQARRLRRADTGSEQLLWAALRGRRLSGLKFIRQMPAGPYTADFACREKRLIIEVDGTTHGTSAEIAHDTRRTAWLAAQGWQVLRIWSEDVVTALPDVLETILEVCAGR